MAEIIKTIDEIEDIFELMLLEIFGLDPNESKNQGRVRFPWGSKLGQPGNSIAPLKDKNKDICIVTIIPKDDIYNKSRDRKYIDDESGRDLILVDNHTDVHEVNFCNYGQHAYEHARDIRDGLFNPNIKDFLTRNDFALVPNVTAIRRIPELFNGEWWNRCDFAATFNEYVRRETPVNAIERVRTTIKYVQNNQEVSKSFTVDIED